MGMNWLTTDFHTLFRLDDIGRIERQNDPDRSPGPRFWLGGCAAGNVWGIGAGVPDDVAGELEARAAEEPPFVHPALPRHLDRYLSVLASDAEVEAQVFGLIYELPHQLPRVAGVDLVDGESAEGQALLRSLRDDGMPRGLHEAGFLTPADFWPPWCAARVDGEIASIAFAARLSEVGAELGVTTAEAFRGHGMAAAATAGSSRLASLRSRTLFYSTTRDNVSSQRVTARLGLRLRGASLRIR